MEGLAVPVNTLLLGIERHNQNGRLSNLDAPPIDESRALHKCLVLIRAPGLEVCGTFQRNADKIARLNLNCIEFFIQVRHAIDPSVHVSAEELWEAEGLGEGVVERRPVDDIRGINLYGLHDH